MASPLLHVGAHQAVSRGPRIQGPSVVCQAPGSIQADLRISVSAQRSPTLLAVHCTLRRLRPCPAACVQRPRAASPLQVHQPISSQCVAALSKPARPSVDQQAVSHAVHCALRRLCRGCVRAATPCTRQVPEAQQGPALTRVQLPPCRRCVRFCAMAGGPAEQSPTLRTVPPVLAPSFVRQVRAARPGHPCRCIRLPVRGMSLSSAFAYWLADQLSGLLRCALCTALPGPALLHVRMRAASPGSAAGAATDAGAAADPSAVWLC